MIFNLSASLSLALPLTLLRLRPAQRITFESLSFNRSLPHKRTIMLIGVKTKKNIEVNEIYHELKKFHTKNIFVKLLKLNTPMGSGNVLNTNNCEISVCKTRYKNKIVIFSAIDNLVKGASGQAIQNMNLMYNFKENLGLK